jgi:hypothetical protein
MYICMYICIHFQHFGVGRVYENGYVVYVMLIHTYVYLAGTKTFNGPDPGTIFWSQGIPHPTNERAHASLVACSTIYMYRYGTYTDNDDGGCGISPYRYRQYIQRSPKEEGTTIITVRRSAGTEGSV